MTRTKNNEVNLLSSALNSHVHIILVPSFPPQSNIIFVYFRFEQVNYINFFMAVLIHSLIIISFCESQVCVYFHTCMKWFEDDNTIIFNATK